MWNFLSLIIGCNFLFPASEPFEWDPNPKVDIIFVIDNSGSMRSESIALSEGFPSINLPETNIDYQLAITTTSVEYTNQPTSGIDPGEAGLLLGDPTVIDEDDPVRLVFRKNLFCEATYWEREELPSGDGYVCGDDTDEISQAYLDCLCDNTDWDGRAGSGNEEPLEAALLAMCHATPEPPEICDDPISPFPEREDLVTNYDDLLNNDGLLRERSTAVIVIVGDEGDNSRRMQQGAEDPSPYLDAFAQFEQDVRIVTISPNWVEETGDFGCNSGGARTWMVERLQILSEQTRGLFLPIAERDSEGNCQIADFSQHLEDISSLLKSIAPKLYLQTIPDKRTIRVIVDGEEIPRSPTLNLEEYELDPENVTPRYGDGWSYSSEENAISLWGRYNLDPDSDIKIFYDTI